MRLSSSKTLATVQFSAQIAGQTLVKASREVMAWQEYRDNSDYFQTFMSAQQYQQQILTTRSIDLQIIKQIRWEDTDN
jgi:hypothetical protein